MKTIKPDNAWLTDTDGVNQYMQKLDHPMADVMAALRKVILDTDPEIGEHIKWNAPSFFYTGPIVPFNPKEYKRYIIVFNIFKKDSIRLVFPSGAKINDTTGLLEGDYTDGRRLALFYSMDDVMAKDKLMQQAIRVWLSLVERV